MPDTLENKAEKEEGKTKKHEQPVLPRIDPDVPWYEEHNLDAAKELGVRYNRRRGVYVDEDGCPVLDKFGQPL